MQFAKESQPPNAISRYDSGSIWIRDKQYTGSLALSRDALISDWQCTSVPDMTPATFAPLVALQPQVIVLATGDRPQFPAATLMHKVMLEGVGIEVMNDGAAVRTFNVLLGEGRPVVLALVR